MQKKFFTLILILFLFLIPACKKKTPVKNVRQIEITSLNDAKVFNYRVNIKTMPGQAETETKINEIIKKYTQLSYLDLDINDKKDEFLELFSEDIKEAAEKDFEKLTLGNTATKLTSILSGKPLIKTMSIFWDSNNKPQMAFIEYEIKDLTYLAKTTKITGSASGSLLMTNENKAFKISQYTINQKIEAKKAGKKN